MATFYATTPIYYVNGLPHLGHAYTTIAVDTICRWHRLCGDDVFFLTGTDEHGSKVLDAARQRGISAGELTDQMVASFEDLWHTLHISHSDFIRTTEPRHIEVVQAVFQRLYQQGDIYEGTYSGWYCTPCETFWPESQLGDSRHCPECGRGVSRLEEDTYFFRLSHYQERLLQHYEDQPEFICPQIRRNEILQFVKGGLKDLSVTRVNLQWGIPCPVAPTHSIYVWFDALINYISALGYTPDGERFRRYWPADLHVVGKDIVKFHAVIWPAVLMALELPLPRKVFAHGWWMVKGVKMSKSRNNVVDPGWLAGRFGPDYLRYFLLREVPFGDDGNFAPALFVKRVNSDLANDFGNLLNRTLALVHKYAEGRVPPPQAREACDEELQKRIESLTPKMQVHMEGFCFAPALEAAWEVVRFANLYLARCAPWKLAKEEQMVRAKTVLYNVLETVRWLCVLLFPFIPEGARKMWAQLGQSQALEDERLDQTARWGLLEPGTAVEKGIPVFPRIAEDDFYETEGES